MEKCKCVHCTTYEFYKWAVVMECKCVCHTGDGMTGHDVLCCSIPNGLKKNNPHEKLESVAYYKKILDDWNNSTLC